MKKSLLALALMGAFSGAAFAQSSVTIYGIADAGFQSLDTGLAAGKTSKIQSGQESGSRLGFKGTEDLGGGLKANFVLEMGLNIDDGSSAQGGKAFGRRSLVGLSGDFGAVDLGRDKTPAFKFFDNFDPFASGFINSGNGLSGNTVYFVGGDTANTAGASNGRITNAIIYSTPSNLNGFSALAGYGFGEVAGDTSAGRSLGLNLRYTAAGFDIGYNYTKDNQQAVVGGPINGKKANTIAATYDFGIAKPIVIYQKVQDDAALALDKKVFTVGATVPVDASNKVIATYSKVKDSTRINTTTFNTVGDAKQFALGYQYAMSKRTDLYAAYARTTQDANSKVLTTVSGADVKELTFGIRHLF
ncbi:porin [Undibacterium sp. RTI2.1]|uniref:porin n=1 Tax=unclassified Undibacterium TaxID=2630295 RepID=UPI002AB5C6E4|nr:MULTISPECIES: porin [unclassified Undibacterium]MDY7540532.1 porin [Undibacterium sp. 5I1]MEB0030586.1 porin [Undibacterium sp. RTI2.1]MEB0116526.1 porin [Undibacterium sp. RTI2.2]MEB0231609.1 porin [Undibacterium sp. 10I3]MEB0256497.1 porin [Undibacterium sp. 5I1]